MFTTVLPVAGAALLLSVGCWGAGAALVSWRSPVVAMLAGWCGFLLLCALTWICGLSAHAMRPAFGLFLLAGCWFVLRQRQWLNLATAVACTAAFAFMLGYPFLVIPKLLAYGAHGLDMWGYVNTAEWLQAHSIRELPELGVAPMRFNWTWYVLSTRERPLIYESLACLSAATGLGVVKAYLAYPIALLASLAMALGREPGIFRLNPKCALLAVPVAIAIAFHPMIVLPWIAGFFGGSITAPFIALALAAAVLPGEERDQVEAIAFATLMVTLCGALYTMKLALVGLALGGVPAFFFCTAVVRQLGWRGLFDRPVEPLLTSVFFAVIGLIVALVLLGENQAVNVGEPQTGAVAWAHLLGMFGGSSPYAWLGYKKGEPFDRAVLANPVGLAALVVMAALFAVVAWREWRAARDLRVPFIVALAGGVLAMSIADEVTMAKTLALFGFALLVLLAVAARALRHWALIAVAVLVCVLPAVRSAREMRAIIAGPYIDCTEDNIADVLDGQDWRMLGYLSFREDRDGFDWAKHPQSFDSQTQFLPTPVREQMAAKYHVTLPQ